MMAIKSPEVKIYEPIGPARKQTIIGLDSIMDQIRAHVAQSDLPVFISGETGTGKDLVAREIHDTGPSRSGPFVRISPPIRGDLNFVNAELLGYRVSPRVNRKGLLEAASGGTVFLDEIDLFPLEVQKTLLSVLDEGKFRPVNSLFHIPLECRFITATNQGMKPLIRKGKFLDRLFYRLNGMKIVLPPLRTRTHEIQSMVNFFIEKYGHGKVREIHTDALAKLLEYSFPGNVRELEHLIERICILADSSTIQLEDVSKEVSFDLESSKQKQIAETHIFVRQCIDALSHVIERTDFSYVVRELSINEVIRIIAQNFKREIFEVLLRKTEGDIDRTAAILNMSLAYLKYLMARDRVGMDIKIDD